MFPRCATSPGIKNNFFEIAFILMNGTEDHHTASYCSSLRVISTVFLIFCIKCRWFRQQAFCMPIVLAQRKTTSRMNTKKITGLEKAHCRLCRSVVFSTLSILSHRYIPKCRRQPFLPFHDQTHSCECSEEEVWPARRQGHEKKSSRITMFFYEQVFSVLCSEGVWALMLTAWVRTVFCLWSNREGMHRHANKVQRLSSAVHGSWAGRFSSILISCWTAQHCVLGWAKLPETFYASYVRIAIEIMY